MANTRKPRTKEQLTAEGAAQARSTVRRNRTAAPTDAPPDDQHLYPLQSFAERNRGNLEKKAGQLQFTEQGLANLEMLLLVGNDVKDVSDWFVIPLADAQRLLSEGGQAHDLVRYCGAALRHSVRSKQLVGADENATLAVFLGKQHLGQRDEQHIVQEGVQHHVVGTMPDLRSTPGAWLHQFAPRSAAVDVATALKQLKQEGKTDEHQD